jgi:hypothetical protein
MINAEWKNGRIGGSDQWPVMSDQIRIDKIGILVDWYIGKLVSEKNDYADRQNGRLEGWVWQETLIFPVAGNKGCGNESS